MRHVVLILFSLVWGEGGHKVLAKTSSVHEFFNIKQAPRKRGDFSHNTPEKNLI